MKTGETSAKGDFEISAVVVLGSIDTVRIIGACLLCLLIFGRGLKISHVFVFVK